MDSASQRSEQPREPQDIRLVVDTIPTLAWSARPDGSADFFNQRWLDYTGLAAEQALDWGWQIAVHPDDLPPMMAGFEEALKFARPCEVEGRLRRSDGEFRWFLFRGSPLCDGSGKVVKWYGTNTDIEDRKRAEEALRSNEQNFRLIVDSIPGFVVTTRSTGEIELANRRMLEYFGKTVEEISNWRTSDIVHPDDIVETIAAWTRSIQTGEVYEFENRLRRADGVYRWFHARGLALRDKEGRIVRWYYLLTDVDDRKQAEDKLRRSEAYLANAQSLTHTGTWAINPSNLEVSYWSREIYRIYGLDPDKDQPSLSTALERIHPDDRPEVDRIFKEAIRQNTGLDVQFRVVTPDGTIKHIHTVARPVVDEAGNIVEMVGTTMDVTEQWTARTELEKAFEEIKQRTEAVRRSEGQLRDVINAVPARVWRTSPEGQVDFVNDRWSQFTGLALHEALGWKWQAVIHPDDRTRIMAEWQTALKSAQAMESEARVRRADGEYCWWFIRNVPLRDESGKLVSWYGTSIDIEDRKRAEQALRKSEERWRSVFENSAIGVALTDLNGRFLATNHVYQTMVGYTEEELQALCFLDLTHEDYREANWTLVTELLEGKRRQFQIEKKYLRKDGSSIWVRNNVSLVPGTERVPRFIMALSEDITQRKRAEEALQRSEFFLREAQALSHTGSWAWRLPGREVVHLSDEWYRVYGFDPNQGMPTLEERLQRIHPEDRNKWWEAREEAIHKKSNYDIEVRTLLPDGTIKWVHGVGHPELAASGELVQFVGTVMDVTEQHEARAALETAFEQIKAEQTELRRMTDAIAAYIYVLRPDGTPIYANQIALDYIGHTLEDVQSEDHRARVLHPEDLERLHDECQEALARGKPFELEQRALGKDGKYRWFLVRHNPLHDDRGHIIRWYATGTDIDDRKQVEERIRNENLALREQIDQAFMFEEIVGASPALQSVLSSVVKVAPTDSTVLITGETGTGKELIARAVHKRSRRAGRAFVSVNCAALAPTLISSELFGHEKGAFTGASQRRLGRFELADGGTIFLDEVGELPPDTQVALLRVLQEREFERVGGTQSVRVNVRVIAATNRDLESAVAEGTFRGDLFYRLNVFPIDIPPLRERREDIPLLVEYFIDRFARKAGKNIRGINKKSLDLLVSYPWPGNIRELQNVVERSVIVCDTGYFSIDKGWLLNQPPTSDPKSRIELPEKLAAQEREIIEAALHETGGRVAGPLGAAARLGIHRSTLESKISSLKIDKYRFKGGSLSKRKQT